ncbi:hypothetical protein C8F01DRAFT_1024464, partial [Mycena amicta]
MIHDSSGTMEGLAGILSQSGSPNFESMARDLLRATEANLARMKSQIQDLICLCDRDRSLIAALKLVLAPVRKLPAELLVQIFHNSVASLGEKASGRSQLADVLRLCEVCPHWRHLILHTPHLWTMQLPIGDNPSKEYAAQLQMFLERSSPLSIPVSPGNPDRRHTSAPSIGTIEA